MEEYASNGTYYFKKGTYVKKYFNELMEKDINLKGEYYVSLIYNLLIEDQLKVSIYNVQHMLQWGTPHDVDEYNTWSKYFKHVILEEGKPAPQENSVTLIPLAGRGSRFVTAGYKDPKPLIEVSGKPMIVQASDSLPKTKDYIFVTLQEHLDSYPLENTLKEAYQNCDVVAINQVTEGQAITCSLGLENVDDDKSILVSATDNAIIYNKEQYQTLVEDEGVDAIVFTFRHHVSSRNNPQMYGWVKTDGDSVTGVSVKVPVSDDPFNDHAIVGTFYFRKVKFFNQALENLKSKNIRVNGEFYVDSLIGELIVLGLNVKILEVDDYIGWGTPDDYETFVYWQSFFHKNGDHPYSLDKDITVNQSRLSVLDKKYSTFDQENK